MIKKFKVSNLEQGANHYVLAQASADALKRPLKVFGYALKNFVLVIDDEEPDEAILLLPQSDIHKIRDDCQKLILEHLNEQFASYRLKLKRDPSLIKDVYKVGFNPIGFRITRI